MILEKVDVMELRIALEVCNLMYFLRSFDGTKFRVLSIVFICNVGITG